MPVDIVTERLTGMVGNDWVEVEAIMDQLIPIVAPGLAKRKYQNRSRSERERNGVTTPAESRVLSEDEQIQSGARAILNERILSRVSRGRWEMGYDDHGHRRLRIRQPAGTEPGSDVCKECLRPFPNAAATMKTSTPRPRTRSKVIYVTFPKWGNQDASETSNG